jgi:hypothetical protein
LSHFLRSAGPNVPGLFSVLLAPRIKMRCLAIQKSGRGRFIILSD